MEILEFILITIIHLLVPDKSENKEELNHLVNNK